jgi:hypothetical protein
MSVLVYDLGSPFERDSNGCIRIPERTTEACLWDTFEINGIPYFLPDRCQNGKYYVTGWFCSLNCAMAYNISLGDYKISERISLLKNLYGKSQEHIEPAASIRVLKKYGGILTIDDYRNNHVKCDKEYRIITPPMTHISQTLEEKMNIRKSKVPRATKTDLQSYFINN